MSVTSVSLQLYIRAPPTTLVTPPLLTVQRYQCYALWYALYALCSQTEVTDVMPMPYAMYTNVSEEQVLEVKNTFKIKNMF